MPQQMMAPAFQPPNTSSNNIFGSPHGSQVATHAAGKGGGLGLAASVDIIAVWLPRLPPCCSRWQRMMTGRQHRGEGGSQMAMISNPAAKPKSDLRQHRGFPCIDPSVKRHPADIMRRHLRQQQGERGGAKWLWYQHRWQVQKLTTVAKEGGGRAKWLWYQNWRQAQAPLPPSPHAGINAGDPNFWTCHRCWNHSHLAAPPPSLLSPQVTTLLDLLLDLMELLPFNIQFWVCSHWSGNWI